MIIVVTLIASIKFNSCTVWMNVSVSVLGRFKCRSSTKCKCEQHQNHWFDSGWRRSDVCHHVPESKMPSKCINHVSNMFFGMLKYHYFIFSLSWMAVPGCVCFEHMRTLNGFNRVFSHKKMFLDFRELLWVNSLSAIGSFHVKSTKFWKLL